jgi:hypothetical protein
MREIYFPSHFVLGMTRRKSDANATPKGARIKLMVSMLYCFMGTETKVFGIPANETGVAVLFEHI